jgi:hypothetical protein
VPELCDPEVELEPELVPLELELGVLVLELGFFFPEPDEPLLEPVVLDFF